MLRTPLAEREYHETLRTYANFHERENGDLGFLEDETSVLDMRFERAAVL
jgi:hypothetical protein